MWRCVRGAWLPTARNAKVTELRIADSFTGGLACLTSDEQRVVKTTAFDLQRNLTGSGMSFHKLDKSKNENVWSLRVSNDLRLRVHRTRSGPAAPH